MLLFETTNAGVYAYGHTYPPVVLLIKIETLIVATESVVWVR